MRLSLSTLNWMAFPLPPRADPTVRPYAAAPLEDVLTAAAGAGFRTVGLDTLALGSRLTSERGRREVAAMLTDLDLGCSDVGVLRVGRSDGVEAAQNLARLATAVGADVCATVIDVPVGDTVLGSLERCADILADAGVRLALEFMAFGPLGSLEQAAVVAERVGWERCGLLLDSWHLFHSGRPWRRVASLTADQIALVQLSDGRADITDEQTFFTESRWGRVAPGDGECDFPGLLEALRATGYHGTVSPEALSFGARYREPADCARTLMRSLNESLADFSR